LVEQGVNSTSKERVDSGLKASFNEKSGQKPKIMNINPYVNEKDSDESFENNQKMQKVGFSPF
jgi:hypothetical protein